MDLQTIGVSLGGSATLAFTIVKIVMRSEARKELTPDIKDLHDRCNNIEDSHVDCKFCDRQHNDLNENIKEIKNQNGKILDILIEKK